MSVSKARAILSIVWFSLSIPLVLIVTLQTFMKVYGPDWDKPWTWLLALIFPILGIIVGVWSVSEHETDQLKVSSGHVFWATLAASVVYLSMIYAALFIGSFYYEHREWDFIFKSSSWFFIPFQALVTTALAKFFLENVHHRGERRPTEALEPARSAPHLASANAEPSRPGHVSGDDLNPSH
jgi:hypothetical protein